MEGARQSLTRHVVRTLVWIVIAVAVGMATIQAGVLQELTAESIERRIDASHRDRP